jgi:hypothetical protein
MFYCPEGAEEFSQGFNPGLYTQIGNGEYLKSIAYGTNRNSLSYSTPSRRRGGSEVMVLPHDLELSLDTPKSNVLANGRLHLRLTNTLFLL